MDPQEVIMSHENWVRYQKEGDGPGNYPLIAEPRVLLTMDLGDGVEIASINIDAGFLPAGKEEEYIVLLKEYLFEKFEIYKKDPRSQNEEFEEWDRGSNPDSEAHKQSLKAEMQKAQQKGMLKEYHEHWTNWLDQQLQEETDPEIQKIIQEQISWREQVHQETQAELSSEGREPKAF
jgi:hypothetical protein